MKNKNLSLIGCGWLGHDLALELTSLGFSVIGTTSGKKTSSYLPLNLLENPIVPDVILNSDVLIYMIPPVEISFIKNFFNQIPENKKIIFISSTSVYGKNLGPVDETLTTNEAQASSPLLISTEEYLKRRFTALTILRPGGLYGKKRHPVYFLQGKAGLKTGDELLHLAHLDDVIKAIISVLKTDLWHETFNIVSDLRIPKKDYYTSIAQKLNLSPPQYEDQQSIHQETNISNEKSKNMLGLIYKDPNEFCTFSE